MQEVWTTVFRQFPESLSENLLFYESFLGADNTVGQYIDWLYCGEYYV